MNVEFEKLEVQNFKSVGELVTINYKELKGLNFIYGKNLDVPNAKNGSGKSSLSIDSLSFALFGKTLKNTNNKYLPNRLIGNKQKTYAKVWLRSNGTRYSVETYGRFGGQTMGAIGIELLKIDDNGDTIEDLTQSTVLKTKQYIQENILGCSFNVFKSSVVVSSAEFMNFYEGMNKDQKRRYVENIFNLDCFGIMFQMFKNEMNETKKELTMSKNNVISVSNKLEDLNKKFIDFNEKSENERNELKQKILEKIDELKALEEKAQTFVVKYTSTEIQNKKNKLKEDLTKLEKEKNQLEKQNVKCESDISHINKTIAELKKISEGLCEKCTAMMNERYDYANKQIEIDNAQKTIKENDQRIDEIDAKLSEQKDLIDKLSKKIDEIREIEYQKDKNEISINYLKKDLKNMKDSYTTLQSDKNNPFIELIEATKAELKSLKEQIITFNKNIQHFEFLRDACSESGVKKFIIKDIVKLLNSLIQKYLNEIGCEFIIYFDETFDFKFLTSSGECEFSSFSAGEKQRIQISTILAFRDLILNSKIFSNIFVIDEMLDMNVDSVCIENVMKILKRKSEEMNQNIFIVSHRSELADNEGYWNQIIKVTKENGQSRFELK